MNKKRTIYRVIYKMFSNPLFPIMFYQESVKLYILGDPNWNVFFALGFVTMIIWAASDSIEIDLEVESESFWK